MALSLFTPSRRAGALTFQAPARRQAPTFFPLRWLFGLPYRLFLTGVVFGACTALLYASQREPLPLEGRWIEFDEATGKPHVLIRILRHRGEYQGIVEKPIEVLPGDDPEGLCRCCRGALHNKPIIGMTVLWAMKATGPSTFGGGKVLDPRNGEIYQATLRLLDGGKKLLVRGYILSPLFGRSETWQRALP
jgi:uncharacterized protein (DUF2147 family)